MRSSGSSRRVPSSRSPAIRCSAARWSSAKPRVRRRARGVGWASSSVTLDSAGGGGDALGGWVSRSPRASPSSARASCSRRSASRARSSRSRPTGTAPSTSSWCSRRRPPSPGWRPIQRALALGPLGHQQCWRRQARWKTRMFAPGLVVAEDPATGSAAGPLALHLARHRWADRRRRERSRSRQGAEIGRPPAAATRAPTKASPTRSSGISRSAASRLIVGRGEFSLERA